MVAVGQIVTWKNGARARMTSSGRYVIVSGASASYMARIAKRKRPGRARAAVRRHRSASAARRVSPLRTRKVSKRKVVRRVSPKRRRSSRK